MDIQQTDRESLATYVHRFKWKASRCKFNNDTATIQIFLKGLKNAHTIATKVIWKGTSNFNRSNKGSQKLQATQQITSRLIPTLLVNNMSVIITGVFQCQEVGHMAHYCPHIQCYNCDNYGHVALDCPDKYHHLAHWHTAEVMPTTGMIDPPLGIIATPDILTVITRIDPGSVVPKSCSHNHRYRSSSHHESHRATPGHSTERSQHSFSHHRSSSSYCYHRDTPHHRSSSHRNLSWDDSRSQHKSQKQHYKPAQGSSSSSQATPWKHKDKRQKQVTIDDPQNTTAQMIMIVTQRMI